MTNPNQQKGIEIAAQFMGWRRRSYTWKVTTKGKIDPCDKCGSTEHTGHTSVWEHCICSSCDSWEDNAERGFNPYQDENHFRMLLEKIMEDNKLFIDFLIAIEGGDSINPYKNLCMATLQERMSAFISVYQKDS